MLVIPATNMNPAINSRIFILEINGSIEPVIFNLYPDEETGNDSFSGRIGIFDENEEFVVGYKIEAGTFVSKYVLQKNKYELKMSSPGGVNVTDPVWDDGELNEVFVDADRPSDGPILIVDIYPNHGGDGTNQKEETSIDYLPREGGSTTTPTVEEDKIYVKLDEKELCAYQRLNYAGVNATNYHNLMTQLFTEFGEGNLSNSDLTITSEDLGYSGGKSVYLGDGKFKIIISNMSDRSSIEIAAVILHEMSHAFLAKHYLLYNKSFSELYSMYINDTGLENYRHDIMKDNFLGRMAQTLQDYDSSLFTNFEDYITLASPGVYSNYSDEQLAEIKRIKNYALQNDSRCTISK